MLKTVIRSALCTFVDIQKKIHSHKDENSVFIYLRKFVVDISNLVSSGIVS